MTAKMFVVSATEFEYNDEIHSVGEDGGGTPVAVFNTKEEAERDARSRIVNDFLKGWAGSQLGGFGYEMDCIFSKCPSFLKEDEFWETESYSVDDLIKIKERSDEELESIADCLNFSPYTVTEVPLG